MTGSAFLLFALALVVAAGDWIAVHQGRRLLEYVCKPLTMVVLVAAVLATDPHDGAVRAWFVVALLFSLAGDVFLMLPRDLFVQGLAAFLVAHLAYIVGMHVDGIEAIPFFVGIIGMMLVLASVGRRVLVAVRAGEQRALAGPVVAYMFVIAAMAASAVGTARFLAAVGALLFVTSDALIAWTRFVEDKPWGRLAIIVTYHLGQLGLALSVI
jgi:uncharacterized membrane protein YhhN